MDGPDHFRMAEKAAAEAQKFLSQDEGQDSAAVWAALAQAHAALALTAVFAPNFVPPPQPGLRGVEQRTYTPDA
jgi:hypothetical protein